MRAQPRYFAHVAAAFLSIAIDQAVKAKVTIDHVEVGARLFAALTGKQRFNPRRNAQRKLVDQVGARRYKRARKALKREALA